MVWEGLGREAYFYFTREREAKEARRSGKQRIFSRTPGTSPGTLKGWPRGTWSRCVNGGIWHMSKHNHLENWNRKVVTIRDTDYGS